MSSLKWYLSRLTRMAGPELVHRARDVAGKRLLAHSGPQMAHGWHDSLVERAFRSPLNVEHLYVDEAARDEVVRSARRLLEGRARVFSTEMDFKISDPDWFLDPATGHRAPSREAFDRINVRDWPGSVKHVWEPSRHQQLTVLATAWALTRDDLFAKAVSDLMTSWFRANPPFLGIHWTSGIELGMRLISWVWARRMLTGHRDAPLMFEQNDEFLGQLYAHQTWLSRLPSHGSSANNHLIAEAAGQFIACQAFPVFRESLSWAASSQRSLEREAGKQVDPDGVHREQATDYHGYVCELLLLAGVEAIAAQRSVDPSFWQHLCGMFDVIAAMLDSRLAPPRHGDSDDAVALQVDGESFNRWTSLLHTGDQLFGAAEWWPDVDGPDIRSAVIGQLAAPPEVSLLRSPSRPVHFAESGLTILRVGSQESETWCAVDAGPLGYLSTASHGHADALSMELRIAGHEVLVDPGTYCYQTEPVWRDYFRSTRAHNTLEIEGFPQAVPAGPFLWNEFGVSRTMAFANGGTSRIAEWAGAHTSSTRKGEITHTRRLTLTDATLTVVDSLSDSAIGALRYHLSPDIECRLEGSRAHLKWKADSGEVRAIADLPNALTWRAIRGRESPPMGWFSPQFGDKRPTTALEGTGQLDRNGVLVSRFQWETPHRDIDSEDR